MLDIGAADGSVARRLVERGCRVFGVEIDARSAVTAEQVCERVVVADVESIDLAAELDQPEFDVVLLLDVLEHLRDPLATLKAATALLRPGGKTIISVPNVTHGAVRLQLLSGRFSYTDTGLLDRTHLHMFDRPTLERLLERAGLRVLDRMRVTAGLTQTEIEIVPDEYSDEVIALALSGPDAETYQFVYVATPGGDQTSSRDVRSLGEVLQGRALEAERVRSEVAAYALSLEVRLPDVERERDRFEKLTELADARANGLEAELRERMSELESLHEELAHAHLDLTVKDAQLAQLHAELAPLRARLDRAEKLLGYTGRRIVGRASTAVRRFPRVYRGLKRVAERLGYRRP